MNKRNLLIGLAVLGLVAIAAYVAWDRHQTRQLHDTTLSRISDASRALRVAFTPMPAPDPAAHARTIAASAERVDQDLMALRNTSTSRILLLGAGADGYLVTARELLRRQAIMLQLQNRIGGEIIAFRDHMLSGNRSAADWTTQAVGLKNQLENDFREYQRTVEAHTKIADDFPNVHKVLLNLAPEDKLIAATEVAAARDAELAVAKKLTAEIEAVRRIAAPR